jgi:LruC domain-containing protein
MKDIKWHIGVALSCVMIVSGCVRNQFDQQRYEEIVEDESPTPKVDPDHDWMMSTTKTLVVDPSGIENLKLVRIFTDNPAEEVSAEIVDEAYSSGENKIVMNISYPIRLQVLYAAAIDSEDYYTIVPINPNSSGSIDFSNPVVKHQKMPYFYVPQTYVYLFEEEYPQPGDYDFNDVVLRISMERSSEREVRFNIQLAAVGGTKQMGAAIRFAGYKYDEIESVKTVDDASFDITGVGELPDMYRTMIQDKDLLLQSLNGEAVLNLFADAHWATGDRIISDNGSIMRKRYNVSYERSDEYGTFFPREITYIVKFKNGVDVSSLTLNELDAFIIEEYNGNKYEVHTHNYAKAQVLYPNPSSDPHNLPWAFCVPYDNFRWPLHAVAIGYQAKSKGFSNGAYPYLGSSFGEWAADRTKCIDWYLYPDNDQVYK